MAEERVSAARADRRPPHSDEAEAGVLGSILLDADRVLDLCVEQQLVPESFYVPAHRLVFQTLLEMSRGSQAVDVLTVTNQLRSIGQIDKVGGPRVLEQLIDGTPTSAHAGFYIDIVRQKHLLRCIIDCARETEADCYQSESSADDVLSKAEQAFLDITERQHGTVVPWPDAIEATIDHVEQMLRNKRGIQGLSTGFLNLDRQLQGMKQGEMIVLAARPSMGKTSLAMNIAENVALGKNDPEHKGRPVGIFILEMALEALVLRMLCSHSRVQSRKLSKGFLSQSEHGNLMSAASLLRKAPIVLDDTGGLDVLELRARARRMRKKSKVELIVIDYLQLLHSRDFARQGRQIETANISGHLKAMAKELRMPVLVLSQLSRAPEQRGPASKPKLSDLRDSGAIEQDADVVCMLRRPSRYPDDPEHDDERLAIVDVAKQRNGPTGEIQLNFEEEHVRFEDRATGVDGVSEIDQFSDEMDREES